MKASIIAMSLLVLSACSHRDHAKVVSIDPAFLPYVTTLQQDAARLNLNMPVITDLIIAFDNSIPQSENFEAGLCDPGSNATPKITISAMVWNGFAAVPGEAVANALFKEYSKRQLLYHEIGHCLLGRGHNDSVTEIDINIGGRYKRSIMNSTAGIMLDFFVAHYDQYITELFGTSEGPTLQAQEALIND
jgi:hypothetical protein